MLYFVSGTRARVAGSLRPRSLGLPFQVALEQQPPPPWRQNVLPVIVHVDCLNCSIVPATVVQQCFARLDVLNVVVAEDADEYRDLQRRTPNARVVYGEGELAREMGAAFGPRLYIYHSTKGLVYAQPAPSPHPLIEVQAYEGR